MDCKIVLTSNENEIFKKKSKRVLKKEKKQRGCSMRDANKHTHILYSKYKYEPIYTIYLFETIVSKVLHPPPVFLIIHILPITSHKFR